jgi:hypothetical protein
MASDRACVRAALFYAPSGGDLSRVALLSARIPHAVQSVPLLVRHHLESMLAALSALMCCTASRNDVATVRQPSATVAWFGPRPAPLARRRRPIRPGQKTKEDAMTDAFGAMLDSGVLYLAVGAVICVILGVGAARRLFQGAKKAEPPDPPEHPRRKH